MKSSKSRPWGNAEPDAGGREHGKARRRPARHDAVLLLPAATPLSPARAGAIRATPQPPDRLVLRSVMTGLCSWSCARSATGSGNAEPDGGERSDGFTARLAARARHVVTDADKVQRTLTTLAPT
jgi:hypothetical protein